MLSAGSLPALYIIPTRMFILPYQDDYYLHERNLNT